MSPPHGGPEVAGRLPVTRPRVLPTLGLQLGDVSLFERLFGRDDSSWSTERCSDAGSPSKQAAWLPGAGDRGQGTA